MGELRVGSTLLHVSCSVGQELSPVLAELRLVELLLIGVFFSLSLVVFNWGRDQPFGHHLVLHEHLCVSSTLSNLNCQTCSLD